MDTILAAMLLFVCICGIGCLGAVIIIFKIVLK